MGDKRDVRDQQLSFESAEWGRVKRTAKAGTRSIFFLQAKSRRSAVY